MMQMIRVSAVIGVTITAAAVAYGCASGPDASPKEPSSPPDIVVAASAQSTQELGVVEWKLTRDSKDEQFAVTGYDANANVRSEIVYWFEQDSSGAIDGGFASTVQGPAYFHYHTDTDGHVKVDRNDFVSSHDADRARTLAMVDLKTWAAGPAGDAPMSTASVHPLGGAPGTPPDPGRPTQPGIPLVSPSDQPLVDWCNNVGSTPCRERFFEMNDSQDNAMNVCCSEWDPFNGAFKCTSSPACDKATAVATYRRSAFRDNSCEQCWPVFGAGDGGVGNCPSQPGGVCTHGPNPTH
jgi:hypothetical protein